MRGFCFCGDNEYRHRHRDFATCLCFKEGTHSALNFFGIVSESYDCLDAGGEQF
jgi:hypothetical protein